MEHQPHTKEFLADIRPRTAFEFLKQGNNRFVGNYEHNHNLLQQVKETANGQYPFAAVLSCMDSRTSVELTFDRGIGELFSIRIAGNIVNDDILGSLEFAVAVKHVRLIVVLGHTSCGAIEGACDGVELEHLTQLLKKVQPAIDRAKAEEAVSGSFVEAVTKNNVLIGIEDILRKSKTIREIFQKKDVGIVGGTYDIKTGRVEYILELFDGVVPKGV